MVLESRLLTRYPLSNILKDEEKKAMAVGDVFSSDESDEDDGGRMKRYIGNSSDSSSDGMIQH